MNPHFSERSVRVSSQPGLGVGFGNPCTQGQMPVAAHLAVRIGELEASVEGQLIRGQSSGPDGGLAVEVMRGGGGVGPS